MILSKLNSFRIKSTIPLRINLVWVALGLLLSGCPDDAAPLAPRKPIFVNKSSDTSRVDRGIRPDYIQPKAIRLEWYSNPDKNLGGYELFRTKEVIDGQPVNFRKYRTVQAIDTFYIDLDIGYDTTFYYKLKAVSKGGEASLFADSIAKYKVIPKAILSQPTTTDSTVKFKWNVPLNYPGGSKYALKVYENNDPDGNFTEADCISISYNQGRFDSTVQDTLFINYNRIDTNFNSGATRVFKRLKKGGNGYRWRLYLLREGLDNSVGSISFSDFIIPL